MQKYYVESGSLKATILADDAFEAAVESIHWWGGREETPSSAKGGQRLPAEIAVYDRGFRRGAGERFATLKLLAHINGEPAEAVWRRAWQAAVAQLN